MFKLINGDCLEVMQSLIDDGVKVDMILTDPPYLMNYCTHHRKNKTHDFTKPIKNDDNFELIQDMMPLLYELLRDGGAMYMFCNSNHIDYFKQQISQHFNYKNILIWIKNNQTMGDLKTTYGKKTEFIVYASKGRHELNGKRDNDLLEYSRVHFSKLLHQNQKPVPLLEFLINKSSQPNDTILDCFMGSGSTAIACKNTNRQFIGIELDKDYYQIAQERCKNYQTKLEV